MGYMRTIFQVIVMIATSIVKGMENLVQSIARVFRQKKIQSENEKQRGLTNSGAANARDLLPSDLSYGNTVISGGVPMARALVIESFVEMASTKGMPVVVIHESDAAVISRLSANPTLKGKLILCDAFNPNFDPFVHLKSDEIAKLVIDTAKKDYDIKPTARFCIEGLVAYLAAGKTRPNLKLFSTMPLITHLSDRLNDLVLKGTVDDTNANKIEQRLLMGQDEYPKLQLFFSDLANQFNGMIEKSKGQKYSIKRAVADKKVITIDVISNTNTLMIDLLINQIRQTVGQGLSMMFVSDGLAISETHKSLYSSTVDRCKLVASCNDLLSSCGGDDKFFDSVVGNTAQKYVFRHTSGGSATKWADTIGQYDKTELSQSYGKTGSMAFPLGMNTNKTDNYNIKREHIVKTEEITRMADNELYVVGSASTQVNHSFLA
jgi:hypothetical protein